MKKLFALISLVALFALSAHAYAVLTSEQNNGAKRICFYSDGSAITVSGTENCPLSKE